MKYPGVCALVCALFLATSATAQTPDARAKALVAKMTLKEKVAQLQADAPAIPRLHVPAYNWWNEGLHGLARGGYATVFPQSIGLAASWDPRLLNDVGTVVSIEARARFNAIGVDKGHGRYQGLTIWAPNINIDRDPRWGRGQETYGEDPYLTGQLAVAFIRGIQGDDPAHPRAIATPKHFAVHSGPEPGRHGFDVDVSPHDLEATYLPAFRAAVTEGHAGSVMCAYNALHGTPVCADRWLLTTLLRKDWGFKGYVVSDCDAVDDMTHFHYFKPDDAQSSAAAIKAGTDLDCGNAYASLGEAVRKGYIKESVLDAALARLFAARYRLGILGNDADGAYAHIGLNQLDSRAHRELALRAALESIVLLKNEHATLPLKAGINLAVVGPDADTVETLEASYHGTARHPVTPLEGLRKRFGADHVGYAQGSPITAGVPIPIPETALRTDGKPGLKGEYFANTDFSGTPRVTRTDRTIDFDWDHVTPAAGLGDRYAVRWTGELIPPGPGDYTLAVHVDRCFDCHGHDPVRLYLDGKLIIDSPGHGKPMQAEVHFTDTAPHKIELEMVHSGQDQGIRLQWLAPPAAQLAEAEAAVRHADVVVAFVGLSPDVEGEELPIDVQGFDHGDRTDIALPAAQRILLEHVAATGKPLVVVLMSGGAVAIDWAQQHADAILDAWYPGEAGGTAIAQTLAGDYDPAGRLPVTFYRSTRDLPPYVSYSMQGRTYRYFKGTPLYPFGYGLSYTTFAYADLGLPNATLQAGATLKVRAEVRNTGRRAGDEVVQVYLDYPKELALAPRHALVGFRRVHLEPGERRTLDFELTPRQLGNVDAAGVRAVTPGRYSVFVGGGQPGGAAGVSASFTISGRDVLSP
ncbi:MAG: glycoside hydrolase family 3 protein [Rhodanobacteraceae bacterium]|nr:MAG: glycoside hydrolase family 3 protein [Rhodanobacteraceae bacterium]